MVIALALAAAILGAFWRRWMGSAPTGSWLGKVPGGARRALGFVLGAVVGAGATTLAGASLERMGGAVAASVLVAVVFTLPHGDYMVMGRSPATDDSPLAGLFKWIKPEGLKDFIAMTAIYGAIPIVAGVGFMLIGGRGWVLFPVGLLVAAAYWIAWKVAPTKEPTTFGEYAAGALIYGALALI